MNSGLYRGDKTWEKQELTTKQKIILIVLLISVMIRLNTGCCVLHSVFDSYNDLVDSVVIEDLCGSTFGNNSHECDIQILKEY